MIRPRLSIALRRLRRSPGFTAVALLSLALGIGANTAIFSIVNAFLLRPTPFAEPERLVDLYESEDDAVGSPLSYLDLEDIRRQTGEVFTGVAATGYALLQGSEGDGAEMLPAEVVSADYFSLLGLEPALGRGFTADDERERRPVVILDHLHWQSAHGGDPSIVGRSLRLSGGSYTVIGVAPADYGGNLRGLRPALYAPITLRQQLDGSAEDPLRSRDSHWVFARARLRPGVELVEAQGVLDTIVASLRTDHPESWDPAEGVVALPTTEVAVHPILDRFVVPAAGLLLAVVGAVLLIACANLASFLLARATDRRKEIAVQLALGATRRSLVVQLLTETVLLALVGGVLGVALAVVGLRVLTGADLPLPVPMSFDFSLDLRVLAFALGISLVAGVLFGLAPALQSARPNVAATLKDESTGGGRPRRVTLRRLLVAGQVAASTLLLVVAGLFVRSLMASQQVDPGFGDRPTAILNVLLPSVDYPPALRDQRIEQLRQRFQALPGVEAVGMIDNLHLNLLNTQGLRLEVDGVPPPEGQLAHYVDHARIDPGFLDAAGVELLEGRAFTDFDDADSPPVALVSRAFAERFFPDGTVVGRTLRTDEGNLEVVGVVSDAKVRTLVERPRPFVYQAWRQSPADDPVFLVRTTGSAEGASMAVLQAARTLDPDLRILESKTMERHLATLLLPARLAALFVAAFAVLALLLAAIGLYGVVSYSVAQRSREVGIRLSLGASPSALVGLLMRDGLLLVGLGGAFGLALSVVVGRLVGGLLYGVGTVDPLTLAGVPLVLSAVALLATFLPARRVSRIHPARSLRAQ